jgi:protein arginine kinase
MKGREYMSWYLEEGPMSDVVVSTRIRFARNIKNIKFINMATAEDNQKVIDIFEKNQILPNLKLYRLKDIDMITKMSLVEKHLISPDIIKDDNKETAIILSEDESICIMLNEEDHIRIQVISAGLELEKTLAIANQIDDKISKIAPYAYDNNYGYLTSCPTNVGTGMRCSVMLHLPALTASGYINKVLEAINKFGVNIRGLYGEGTEALGNMYQISNKISLGVTEKELIDSIRTISEKVIEQERYARKYLQKQGIDIEDKVYRAYGTLTTARKLSTTECARLLSDIRLGIDLDIIKELDSKTINELIVLTKPASLQKYYKATLEPEERDIKRAELIKNIINKK